ncbi:sulfurtransferase TusA family protein [Pseudoleptotrichia goodfellowii]|uniref:SirA-like domain-containing protein n=1 Tax=Pseudoleptotrichia goodfellowii TaxID=157692 RepID=A0A510J9B1_9FUSO|nr:sulfurtransferase TusA family protein [Pseudoleptotrichia goodfellowii]BBM35890.1 SirA-like domain-containing protein [Pseudoleptotrichia goodfellowii]
MKEYTLDCLGEACPIPLIKTQKKFETMETGDVLIINVDHSCAIKNIPEWAQEVGYNCEVEEVSEGEWNIIVEKSK